MTRRLLSPLKSQLVVFNIEFWQRAPYFSEGDNFGRRVLERIDAFGDFADLTSGLAFDRLPANTIARFEIDRGDIAYSDLQITTRLGVSHYEAWAAWTDAILEEFSPVLRSA